MTDVDVPAIERTLSALRGDHDSLVVAMAGTQMRHLLDAYLEARRRIRAVAYLVQSLDPEAHSGLIAVLKVDVRLALEEGSSEESRAA